MILYSQVNYMITPMVDVRMHHEYQHGQEVGHTKLNSLRKGQSEIDLPPKLLSLAIPIAQRQLPPVHVKVMFLSGRMECAHRTTLRTFKSLKTSAAWP